MASFKYVYFLLFVISSTLLLVSNAEEEEEEGIMPPSLIGALGSKLAAADNYDDDDDSLLRGEDEASKPCCFPTAWQGRLVTEFGFAGKSPAMSHSVDQLYIDGTHTRLAGDKMQCGGHGGHHHRSMNVSYIVLMKANKTADLYLFNRAAKKCRHKVLKGAVWRQQCIPANATLRGTFKLGPNTGGVTVQSWTFQVGHRRAPHVGTRPHPRPKLAMGANILVEPRSCIPVVVQEHGSINTRDESDTDENEVDLSRPKPRPRPRGIAFLGSAYFSNVVPKITDPKVFTPPSYCKRSEDNALFYEDMEQDEEMPSVLERFLVL